MNIYFILVLEYALFSIILQVQNDIGNCLSRLDDFGRIKKHWTQNCVNDKSNTQRVRRAQHNTTRCFVAPL